MNISPRFAFALVACLTGFALYPIAGCGSESSSDAPTGVDGGGDGGPRADCRAVAAQCETSADCCSSNCDSATKLCAAPIGTCKAPNEACTANNECCTFSCTGGKCSAKQCIADNAACTADADCCGGKCGVADGGTGGTCTPLNAICKTSGNPCAGNGDCCSKFCNNGICNAAPSFCTQEGDACSTNGDCCGGTCTKAAGAALGICGAPVVAPGVPGCTPAGSVCSGGASFDGGIPECGGECCSRSCAPYAATGVLVCQPPSGCHPTGEICRVDSDCCGWSGSPDPKKGPVTCSKADPTQEIGRCDNGGACREPGSICKPADYSCNAENNCCDPVGEASNYCNNNPEKCCRRDALGIPRCLIKPIDCTTPPPAGTTCATSADCCGQPCIDNKCGSACVPAAGGCTTTADCCQGSPCILQPGSAKGVCGASVTPDAGSSSSGGSTSSSGGSSSGTVCAQYGQQCSTAADCCNGVPCTSGFCITPVQ